MATTLEDILPFLNPKLIEAEIKATEAKTKQLKKTLANLKAKFGKIKFGGKSIGTASKKSAKRGNVKGGIKEYLTKHADGGTASEIAKATKLNPGSVTQALLKMKTAKEVTQDSQRGSPFKLAKK